MMTSNGAGALRGYEDDEDDRRPSVSGSGSASGSVTPVPRRKSYSHLDDDQRGLLEGEGLEGDLEVVLGGNEKLRGKKRQSNVEFVKEMLIEVRCFRHESGFTCIIQWG